MNLMMAERWMETAFGAVIEATILASVLIVLVLAVQWIAGRRLGPIWRFALWGIVLVRLLLPTAPESRLSLFNARGWFAVDKPAVSMVQVEETEAPVMTTPGAVELPVESGAAFPVEIPAGAQEVERTSRWWTVLMMVWAAGVFWHFARLAVASVWLGRRVRRVESGEVQAASEEAARLLGTRWKPRVMQSPLVVSPALFGILRPRLLLPVGFAERMSARELRHVFLHEMAHLKRGDLITNALMALAQGLHWMNPLVWFAMRQMRVERELACDELVLRAAGKDSAERRAYGETILRLMEGVPVRRSFSAAVGIAEEKHSARKRMEQIAAFDGRRSRGRAVGFVLIGAMGWCGLTNAQVERQESASAIDGLKGESAGEVQTAVERLRREARNLSEVGKLDEAEQKLIEAQKLAPQHRELNAELKVLKERRFSNEARKREASVSDPANNWDSTTPRFSGTESTRTNRIHSGKGRHRIVNKLNEIVIDHYELPNGLKLEEIIKDIHRIARDRDPEKRGVNFVISSDVENQGLASGAAADGSGDARGLKVGDYEVRIKPALRDVTLGGLLDAIVEVAVPPKGSEGAPRLRYSVEEYAVVFGQRRKEAPQLYTRTFKLDPNTFLQGLDLNEGDSRTGTGNTFIQAEGENRLTAVQEAVREFFESAGIDFSTIGKPGGPQKAIFFNDRTGVLMARLPLEELEIVQRALQRLNVRPELQMMISVEAVEVSTPEKLAELTEAMKIGGKLRTTFTNREYREFQAVAAKRGFKWSKRPPVTTYSGGAARVQVRGDDGVDVMAVYRESDKTFKVRAVPSDHVRGIGGAKETLVGNGETLVLMPFADEKALKSTRVLFIRLDLVDAAGNRVNAGE